MKMHIYDEGAIIYVSFLEGENVTRRDYPHSLVRLDYNKDRQLVGVEIIEDDRKEKLYRPFIPEGVTFTSTNLPEGVEVLVGDELIHKSTRLELVEEEDDGSDD